MDVEHPTPGQMVGEPAAKRSSDDGTKYRTHAPDRHCRAMTFRRVDIEQDRLTHRSQGSTENALQQAEDHQLAKVRSDPTQPRCKGEANDRELDEPLTAETPCQPAGERRKDGGSNDVGGHHPGDLL